MDCCFGQDTGPQDIVKKTIQPLIGKLIEGYNVCIIAFGATESQKTLLLEGDENNGIEGLVQLSAVEIFKALTNKSRQVINFLSSKQNSSVSKSGFDYYVESSFCEIYDEKCR